MSVYCGPYVKIVSAMKQIEYTEQRCNNKLCPAYARRSVGEGVAVYCTICGRMLHPVQLTRDGNVFDINREKDELQLFSLQPHHGTDFGMPSGTFLVTRHLGTRGSEECEIGNPGFMAISETLIQCRMTQFSDKFAEKIAAWRSEHGADNVTVEYGVLVPDNDMDYSY